MHSVWVATAPFSTTKYTNDPWYLPGDEESREFRMLGSRKANATFNFVALKSRADYRRQEKLYLDTLRNIKSREELLVDFGMKYPF